MTHSHLLIAALSVIALSSLLAACNGGGTGSQSRLDLSARQHWPPDTINIVATKPQLMMVRASWTARGSVPIAAEQTYRVLPADHAMHSMPNNLTVVQPAPVTDSGKPATLYVLVKWPPDTTGHAN